MEKTTNKRIQLNSSERKELRNFIDSNTSKLEKMLFSSSKFDDKQLVEAFLELLTKPECAEKALKQKSLLKIKESDISDAANVIARSCSKSFKLKMLNGDQDVLTYGNDHGWSVLHSY